MLDEAVCSCVNTLNRLCARNLKALNENSDLGSVIYTFFVLLVLSCIIFLLMIRSIRPTGVNEEMDILLDVLRCREELDVQRRQRRRLLKTKQKVSAWLKKTQNESSIPMESCKWGSSPHLDIKKSDAPSPQLSQQGASGSYIPEIVVTPDNESVQLSITNLNFRSRTKSFSLLYDFDEAGLNSIPLTECGVQRPSGSDRNVNHIEHLSLTPEPSASISSVC